MISFMKDEEATYTLFPSSSAAWRWTCRPSCLLLLPDILLSEQVDMQMKLKCVFPCPDKSRTKDRNITIVMTFSRVIVPELKAEHAMKRARQIMLKELSWKSMQLLIKVDAIFNHTSPYPLGKVICSAAAVT